MPWTYYQSTDPDAPVLNGQAGSLIAVLDACLVNGYTDKPAAGWTKAFAGTNLAAYRMGSGLTQAYLRVDDTGPGAATTQEARIWAYRNMTDIDTGTDVMPSTGFRNIRKSSATSVNSRAWDLVADDRTFILRVSSLDANIPWVSHYFGEIYSFMPGDTGAIFLCFRTIENSTGGTNIPALSTGMYVASTGQTLLTDITGATVDAPMDKVAGWGNLPDHGFGLPNLADGSAIMVPLYVRQNHLGISYFRGVLRGCWSTPANASNTLQSVFSSGKVVFTGAGPTAGRAFSFAAHNTTTTSPIFGVEITDSVPRN